MRREEIVRRLERGGSQPPAGQQLDLVEETVRQYERNGLLPKGRPCALWRSCPEHERCWTPEEWDHRPGASDADPESEKGCIFAPWSGPGYSPGGLCVVGVNLRYDGGDWDFGIEFRIATDPGGQEQAMRRGRKQIHKSLFAWRSLSDGSSVLRAAAGASSLEHESGDELAETLLRTARLQAVKCSPDDHRRSQRSEAMRELCPPRYLGPEVDILRPSALVTYGGEAWSAIHRIGEVHMTEQAGDFIRARFSRRDNECEVFAMPHPASHGLTWPNAHRALLASLADTTPQITLG
jgi:hypothetical protein